MPVSKKAQSKTLDRQKNLPTKPFFVEVDKEHAGQRLDNFLITRLKGVPKTHIYRICLLYTSDAADE